MGPVTLAEHAALPGSSATSNATLHEADGTLSGVSDTTLPWSGAVAE